MQINAFVFEHTPREAGTRIFGVSEWTFPALFLFAVGPEIAANELWVLFRLPAPLFIRLVAIFGFVVFGDSFLF